MTLLRVSVLFDAAGSTARARTWTVTMHVAWMNVITRRLARTRARLRRQSLLPAIAPVPGHVCPPLSATRCAGLPARRCHAWQPCCSRLFTLQEDESDESFRAQRRRRMEDSAVGPDEGEVDEEVVFNLEAFDVPVKEWLRQDATRAEVKRRFVRARVCLAPCVCALTPCHVLVAAALVLAILPRRIQPCGVRLRD